METRYPDLAIVDLTLPDRDGLELLSRCATPTASPAASIRLLPLLVLSGRIDELHRLRGFDKGADDVMAKPFSYPELRARVTALLRRSERSVRHGRLRVGTLEIDPAARTVLLRRPPPEPLAEGVRAAAHARERPDASLHEGGAAARRSGASARIGSTRTLDSHACRLRQKLARDGDRYLVNVWGVGYRLVDGPVGDELDAAVLGGAETER